MPSSHRVRMWGARHRRLVIAAIVLMAGVVLISPFAAWLRASQAQPTSKPWYYQHSHDSLARQLNANRVNGNTAGAGIKNGAAAANGANATNLGPVGQDDQALTPDQFAYGERAAPSGYIAPTRLTNGEQQANSMASNSSLSWQELGPDTLNQGSLFPEPVSGRLLAVAVVPGDSNTIYVGSAQGGIWKSANGGHSWKPLTDFQPSLAINSITIDSKHPNIIFAGTGEDNLSCDSYQGMGILRSTDSGNTWTVLGQSLFAGTGIGNILLDPRFEDGNANDEHLIIGAGYSGRSNSSTESCDASRPAGQNPPYGVFTSNDGGATFAETLSVGSFANFPFELGTSDMVMSSTNPNIIYAAEQVEGIFESLDAGHTWTNLDAHGGSGLPAPESGFDRIQLAISQSDPSVLYSIYSHQVFSPIGHSQAFRTSNGGNHWKALTNAPDTCDGQCWYDMPAAVSPTDPNTVFFGGNANYAYVFTLFGFPQTPVDCTTVAALSNLPSNCDATIVKSSDGGSTWQDISLGDVNTSGQFVGFPKGQFTLHPDDHAIVFDPNNPNVMYTGNDGGLYVTSDGGHSWNDLNAGLGTLQFQSVSVSPNGEIFGGTQDNGTEQFKPSTGTTWNSFLDGGDGGLVQVDPSNPNTIYHTYAGPSLERIDNVDTGPTFTEIDFPFLSDSGSFYPAFSLAPSKSSTLYFGTYRIWRSDDKGGTGAASDWTAISPDLTGTNAAVNGCGFSCISSVAVSPVNPNVVVVSTGGGLLWQSTNADSAAMPTWTEIDTATMPSRFITQVVFAPHSASTIYVTYSGFNEDDTKGGGHVFRGTHIGGTPTFTEIDGQNSGGSTALPDLPTNSVLVDPHAPNVLFVGEDLGVYVSTDGGRTWAIVNSGLPHSEVYMLAFNTVTNGVVASTHGRGMWQLTLPEGFGD
jgi:photosystem II stability/assembly factor-like uncharacterized protein